MARRSVWIGISLGVRLAIVLAGPAALLRNELRPRAWDWHTLGVRFESARYEAAALIFTYRIENRTGRSVRLLPEVTQIVLRQPSGRSPVGYPSMNLPLELDARSIQHVEIRLDLPATLFRPLDEPDRGDSLFRNNMAPPGNPGAATDGFLDGTLEDLNGFEVVNEVKGFHLVLPRGW